MRVVADGQLVYRRQEAVPEFWSPPSARGAAVMVVEVREGAAVVPDLGEPSARRDSAPVQPWDSGVEDGGGGLGVRKLVEALGEDLVRVRVRVKVRIRVGGCRSRLMTRTTSLSSTMTLSNCVIASAPSLLNDCLCHLLAHRGGSRKLAW